MRRCVGHLAAAPPRTILPPGLESHAADRVPNDPLTLLRSTVEAWTAEELGDYNFVMRHCATKGQAIPNVSGRSFDAGVQMFALITPPVALVTSVYRRRFGMTRLLPAIGAFGVGAPVGLALGWGRMRNMAPDLVGDRAYRLRHNVTQRRVDDYAAVGAVLGALLTTTVFLRRASIFATFGGGGALGIAGGVLAHVAQTRDVKPSAMVEELKESYPAKAIVDDIARSPESADKVLKGQ